MKLICEFFIQVMLLLFKYLYFLKQAISTFSWKEYILEDIASYSLKITPVTTQFNLPFFIYLDHILNINQLIKTFTLEFDLSTFESMSYRASFLLERRKCIFAIFEKMKHNCLWYSTFHSISHWFCQN